MNTIKINGTDYNFKFGMKGMLYFEKIAGKAFELKTLTDQLVLFYSCLLASNPDKEPIDWDAFLEALDDPNVLEQMQKVVNDKQAVEKKLSNDDDKKKARTTKGKR